MTTEEALDYTTVLRAVRTWSARDRFALVQDVLRTLEPPAEGAAEGTSAESTSTEQESPTHEPPSSVTASGVPGRYPVSAERRAALQGLWGSLAHVEPKPTDEDVKRILEEERMKKYG